MHRTSSALDRLFRSILVELLINVAAIGLLGLFMANHIGEPEFLAPAIVLDLFAISLIVDGGRQLAALGSVDYSAPIVVIQKKLETLRIQRIRTAKWTLLLAPLLWMPLLIVTLEGVFGVNAYAELDRGWLAVNLLTSVAVIPLMVWASRRYADRLQRSPLVKRLMNDLAGRNLRKAEAFLEKLARFEQEEQGVGK